MEIISSLVKFWKKLGPGLVTGAADDDPSGIVTYTQAGAQFGMQYLWCALFALPFMFFIQETCARIGMVTKKGLTENIRENYSQRTLYFICFLLFIANTFNISVDLNAIAACIKLFLPTWNNTLLIIVFAIFIGATQILLTYRTYSHYLKYLSLFLFAYIICAFLVNIQWLTAFKFLFLPHINFNKDSFLMIVAIFGTTISPYMFFWQTNQEIEESKSNGKNRSKNDMKIDVISGMTFSNIIMFFIILISAVTLHQHGLTNIQTAAQAAQTLKPLVGNGAEILFSIGIISMALLSIPVLAGSSAYSISEVFRWKRGLNKKFTSAKGFYLSIIFSLLLSIIINLFHLSPMKGLVYSAVLNGLICPIVLFYIMRISTNKKIMKNNTNPLLTTVGGWIITGFMGISDILAVVFLFH